MFAKCQPLVSLERTFREVHRYRDFGRTGMRAGMRTEASGMYKVDSIESRTSHVLSEERGGELVCWRLVS